jgi:hypothetical protein
VPLVLVNLVEEESEPMLMGEWDDSTPRLEAVVVKCRKEAEEAVWMGSRGLEELVVAMA